jgi:ADP-heptose:LPS heptosyltransferase
MPGVARIAVLRGGGLGDLMFAMPAIESLAATYPAAEIVLLGTPLHAALLTGRPGPVSEVRVLPVAKGVYEPAGAQPDDAAQDEFFGSQQPFDLAMQLHGGGRWSNPFVRRLGARWTVGARAPDAEALDRWLPFRYFQHDMMRWLEVAGLAGAHAVMCEPRLALTLRDLADADEALAGLPRPIVTVHPGATDPRRRWPPERFAEVIAGISGRASVVLVGTGDEAEAAAACGPVARSLVGGLSVPGLVGVLRQSAVVLANDSGPRHLAQAVGTPTVSVYWMGNAMTAGPLGRALNRVHISWTATCPVCGVDCIREDVSRCEHDVSFVADVKAGDVLADVCDLLPVR